MLKQKLRRVSLRLLFMLTAVLTLSFNAHAWTGYGIRLEQNNWADTPMEKVNDTEWKVTLPSLTGKFNFKAWDSATGYYGPKSGVFPNIPSGGTSINVNPNNDDKQLGAYILNNGAEAVNVTITIKLEVAGGHIKSVTANYGEPQPKEWRVRISSDGQNYRDYAVETIATNGTKTSFRSLPLTLHKNDRIIITDGTNTYYRKSNNGERDGWCLKRTNTESNYYYEMPNTPLNQTAVYLWWDSETYNQGRIHFTSDSRDNGSKITTIYVDQETWDGVYAVGYPHAYLLSSILNNMKVSPEYMLTADADGNYTLKNFAIRNTKARTTGNETFNSEANQNYIVRVYYAPNKYIDLEYTEQQVGVQDFGWEFWSENTKRYSGGYPGRNANAIFTLKQNGNDILASTLRIENAGPDADWSKNALPYLGILGKNFRQEKEYPTPETYSHDNLNLMGSTEYGWQEAYIQYDQEGRPIIQNGKALYNTLWPPRENILMQAKLPGLNVPLNVSTRTLRFYPTEGSNGAPEIMTGAEWKNKLQAEDPEAYSGLEFTNGNDQQRYIRYVCPNMWMQGEFKIWTGWGGQTVKNNDGWGAQWNNHLYFSAKNGASDESTQIVAGKTYEATSDVNGINYNVQNRGFFSNVEIYIPVDNNGKLSSRAGNGVIENFMDGTRLYVTNSRIQAKIDATKNNTERTAYYHPTVQLNGCKINSFKIVRCDFTQNPGGKDITKWQPVDRNYKYRLHTDKDAIVYEYKGENGQLDQAAFDALFTADITGNDGNPWNLDGDFAPGTYFYYLQINYNDGEKDRTEVVTSPYVAVIAGEYETQVRVYQLVRNTTDGATNKYVTYNPNFATQYDVTLDADDKIVNVAERSADNLFDYAGPNAEWTAKVGVATNLPGLYRINKDPLIQSKSVKYFAIRYAGEEVADITKEANIAFANRPGQSFYAVKEFYDGEKFTDFSQKWDADFVATLQVIQENGEVKSEERATKQDNIHPTYLNLSMPVWGVKDVEFEVIGEGLGRDNVALYDSKAGDELHKVDDALINTLNATINFKEPNVEAKLKNALFSITNPEVLSVGSKIYDVKLNDAEAGKSVTLVDEDPNAWLDKDWNIVKKDVTLAAENDNYFNHTTLQAYAPKSLKTVEAALTSAQPLQLGELTFDAYRAKIQLPDEENPGQYKNLHDERLYLLKTNIFASSPSRSSLNDVTLNNDNTNEHIVLARNGEVVTDNYAALDGSHEMQGEGEGKHYHRYSNLEKEENLVLVAKSNTTCTWYDGMYDDLWIGEDEIPTMSVAVANFFTGNTHAEGEGLSISERAAASAPRAVEGETATHYVLYPPETSGTIRLNIITSVDAVEADSTWILAGNGWFEIKAEGVSVYDMNGIKVASTPGRYDASTGVYTALQGRKAVKIMVK